MEEKRGRRCCLQGSQSDFGLGEAHYIDIDGLRLSKESQFNIRPNVSWVLCERVSRQIYANALQRPREIPRGFVGVKPQPESLILAQNERWRQA